MLAVIKCALSVAHIYENQDFFAKKTVKLFIYSRRKNSICDISKTFGFFLIKRTFDMANKLFI